MGRVMSRRHWRGGRTGVNAQGEKCKETRYPRLFNEGLDVKMISSNRKAVVYVGRRYVRREVKRGVTDEQRGLWRMMLRRQEIIIIMVKSNDRLTDLKFVRVARRSVPWGV